MISWGTGSVKRGGRLDSSINCCNVAWCLPGTRQLSRPSSLLEPPSSAHHCLDSSQQPLASNNINHSPLTNDWNLWCKWWTVQQHALEQQHQFPTPLLTDELLRNGHQCQWQSVSEWTLGEVRLLMTDGRFFNKFGKMMESNVANAACNAAVLRGPVAST